MYHQYREPTAQPSIKLIIILSTSVSSVSSIEKDVKEVLYAKDGVLVWYCDGP